MKALRLSGAAMEDRFANEDLAIEILSRLPVESVQELKCVSKRWFGIFSSHYFAIAQFQRSLRTNPGLLVQGVRYCNCCRSGRQKVVDYDDIDYITSDGEEGKYGTNNSKKIFEFLPQKKTRVVASSNGIVLCCNLLSEGVYVGSCHKEAYSKKVVLYVCNPLTKEWTSLSPKGRYKGGCYFGFAYDPFGSSSTSTYTGGSFQVVMIIPPRKLGQDPYCFNIYSSKTGRWRKLKQVCMLPDGLYLHQSCYASGVFYWMIADSHSILGFDIRSERCEVINLPGQKMRQKGKCMGVSEGKLQYVSINMVELVIWELDNSGRTPPNWVVRYKKLMKDMTDPLLPYMRVFEFDLYDGGSFKQSHVYAIPRALQDDMLYMMLADCLASYDVKTGKIEELCYSIDCEDTLETVTVIPYSKSLLQVQNRSAIAGGTKGGPDRILKIPPNPTM